MPIYEWRCGGGHLFEVLTATGASKSALQCPSCGAKSARVISTFAIRRGLGVATASEKAAARDTDVTGLKPPSFARLCGMDDYSATRLAAYKVGRGTEFDDKMASRQEGLAALGKPPPKATSSRKPKSSD
jgi:putative FmdB family regulatory protein